MNWLLELIVVPVGDMDRAKSFYMDQAGFELLVDHRAGEDFRVIQLNPRGSACAIALMHDLDRAGTVRGLHLIVGDIEAARSELVGRGLPAGDFVHYVDGTENPGLDPGRADYNSFFSFNDPDGNVWLVQEVRRAG
jgi:catechol 2,3-dioxygenase-like lactoylglutathione lyase family enzyme